MTCAESIYFFVCSPVFPLRPANHQDKTPSRKHAKSNPTSVIFFCVTNISRHSNIHKIYALNDLFLNTIIYIRLIITITSFVIKGDGKFFCLFWVRWRDWNIFAPFPGQLPAAGSRCFSHSSVKYPGPQSWEATAAHPVQEFRRGQKWKEKWVNQRGAPLLVSKEKYDFLFIVLEILYPVCIVYERVIHLSRKSAYERN